MNIIVGLERKADTFANDEGKSIPYDNTMIYFITDSSNTVTGFKCGSVKVKTKTLTSSLGCDVSSLPMLLNNKAVDFTFDLSFSQPVINNVIVYNNAITFNNEVKK